MENALKSMIKDFELLAQRRTSNTATSTTSATTASATVPSSDIISAPGRYNNRHDNRFLSPEEDIRSDDRVVSGRNQHQNAMIGGSRDSTWTNENNSSDRIRRQNRLRALQSHNQESSCEVSGQLKQSIFCYILGTSLMIIAEYRDCF